MLPDVVTYSTLIDGYCKASRMQDALEVLDSMVERGILPDVVTYTTLIAGYCKEGEMEEAMKLHNEMIDKGMVPDPITYLVLSHGLDKVENVQEADGPLIEKRAEGNWCFPWHWSLRHNSLALLQKFYSLQIATLLPPELELGCTRLTLRTKGECRLIEKCCLDSIKTLFYISV